MRKLCIEIIEQCTKLKACFTEFNPLKKYFETGDYDNVLATCRGSRYWVLVNLTCVPRKILNNGRAIRHWGNGNLAFDYCYSNGKYDGRYQSWYDNGNISEDCHYKNGKREGRYQSWLNDGSIWEDYHYKNGVKQ